MTNLPTVSYTLKEALIKYAEKTPKLMTVSLMFNLLMKRSRTFSRFVKGAPFFQWKVYGKGTFLVKNDIGQGGENNVE